MTESAVVESVGAGEFAPASMSDLIREAYISPVRSVLVVDDEFPSLDQLVGDLVSGTPSHVNPRDAEYVREILEVCRDRDRPWLVDVHDGKKVSVSQEVKFARRLHHSDLMILDFHLSGESAGGEASVNVVRNIAKNGFFNLVVVYTRGNQLSIASNGDFRSVFFEVLASLTSISKARLDFDAAKIAEDALQIWADDEPAIEDRFKSEMDRASLVLECHRAGCYESTLNYDRLCAIVGAAPEGVVLDVHQVMSWLLIEKVREFSITVSDAEPYPVDFHFDDHVNWIRTPNIFLTVISKDVRPSKLEGKLVDVLEHSKPVPHQLLMAKMRSEVERRGSAIEADVLANTRMQYGWLSDLLSAGAEDQSEMASNTIDRHWEALGDGMRPDVEGYVARMVGELASNSASEVLAKYYPGMTRSEDVLFSINSYVSTKPVRSSYLTTGHVIALSGVHDDAEKFWVCLSPACDLVPTQKTRPQFGDRKPFVAALLHPQPLKKALEKASFSTSIFLSVDGHDRSFSICPRNDVSALPVWEHMYADSSGRFKDARKLIHLARAHTNRRGILRFSSVEARVVGQLRYEYAINLMHRLSGALGRVGLDYRK